MSNVAIDLMRDELSKKSIPLTELIAFKKEIDGAIQILQDEMQESMIQEFRDKVLANGFELESFAQRLIKNSTTKNEAVTTAKYKNPNEPFQTWSGHGKQPKWFKALIEEGKNKDDLKIKL